MILPFLSKLSEAQEDYVSAFCRMYKWNASLPISPTEFEQQLHELLRLLSSDSSSRTTCYSTIAKILSIERSSENLSYFQALIKSINSILDRLGGLMESIATENEGTSFLSIILEVNSH